MTDKEWLDGLKAGDLVVVNGSGYEGRSLARVERTTATLVLTTAGKYSRTSGGQVPRGSTWHSVWISPATAEVVQSIGMARARRRLASIKWADIPDDVVVAVWNLVRAPSDEAE